ncbi:MAG: LolA family protein [Alphaproteobacteria bacterium]
MHAIARVVFCAALALGLAAPGGAAQQAWRNLTAAQKADLKRVSDYVNAIRTLKGDFMQVNPDGSVWEGTFYLSKPGKMRFEYRPPAPHLIVADGSTLSVENKKLKTLDRYPLIGSPLALLLAERVDLSTYTHINGVKRQPGYLMVSASAASGGTRGDITITFSDPGLELRQWEVLDSSGYKTTVVLNSMQTDVALAPALFVAPTAQRRSQN